MAKPSSGAGTLLAMELSLDLSRAVALRKLGRLSEAGALCRKVLTADPRHIDALRLMAAMALQTGAADLAIDSLKRALVHAPRSATVLAEYGRALTAAGRQIEAITAFRKSLTIYPASASTQTGLGEALLDVGKPVEALRAYRAALAIDPQNRIAAHMVSALTGQPSFGVADYVPILFDAYASTFESHLVRSLDYHVPEHLAEAVVEYRPGQKFGPAVDLGCGTGLVGAALSNFVDAMDGIDIAPKMTEATAAKGIYRSLASGDIVEVLSNNPAFAGAYDLVTAADVFIYVGRLEAIFTIARQRLASAGLFAFSVEEAGEGDVVVRSSGRFAHGHSYIASLAATHDFTVLDARHTIIRKELNVSIPGRIYVLRAA